MFEICTVKRNQCYNYWSVCLLHTGSGRKYWLDVGFDADYRELDIDWNQYIFHLSDSDDVERKAFQEDCDNFDAAASEAIYALESAGEIYQDNDGYWYALRSRIDWQGEETLEIKK